VFTSHVCVAIIWLYMFIHAVVVAVVLRAVADIQWLSTYVLYGVCLQVCPFHMTVKHLQPKLFLSLFLLVWRLYEFFSVCITNYFL